MARRLLTVLIVGLALVGVGFWVYDSVFTEPRPPEVTPPEFTDDQAKPLPPEPEFEQLVRTDPVAALGKCLSRYTREVHGFRATLDKRERIGGELYPPADQPPERVKVAVRNDQLAVCMVWETKGRPPIIGPPVAGVLYPYAEEKDPAKTDAAHMAVWRPEALIKYKSVEVKGDLARTSARYCIKELGFDKSMLRTLDAWRKTKERGELRVEYLGCVPVEELGGRTCHVVRRTCPTTEADSFALDEARPADPRKLKNDGFDRVTIYIDAERWIQTGTKLEKAGGELVGEYYFRDLELNPAFGDGTFTPSAIKVPARK